MSEITWEDLQVVTKLKKGGKHREEAISSLYLEYSSKFEWFFIRHRVNKETAQDLVQDTFVNIVKGCDSFRQECNFSAWLWTVARNTMLGHFRKESKHTENINEYEDVDIISMNSDDNHESLEDCVQQAISSFSQSEPARAKVLMLSAIEGWSSDEVATYLDRTAGATREYISQCRKKVKQFMAECEEYLFTSES